MSILAHQRNGQGQPLVVVHGLFGSASNWRNVALKWESDFAIWGVDLRNHGNSFHRQGMSYAQQAEDLLSWLDNAGLDKVCLLGHSMGGKVVMEFALRYPSRVEKLIIVDIAPIKYAASHKEIIASLIDLKAKEPWHDRRQADQLLNEHLGEEAIQTRLFLLTNLRRTADGLRLRLGIEEIDDGYTSILGAPESIEAGKTFAGPTLVIRGTHSDYVPDTALPIFKQAFPEFELVDLEGGHWLHAEQTDAFAAAVSHFIK